MHETNAQNRFQHAVRVPITMLRRFRAFLSESSCPDSGFRLVRDLLLPSILFLVLAVVMTWPIASEPRIYLDNYGDPVLNSWILWRMNENILHNPAHLMDGNIFFPYTNTMAFSETMLAGSLLVMPVHLLSGHPILEHNALMILAFTLNGFGVYLLARKLTGNRFASLLAGMIFAFSMPRQNHIQHIQMLCSHWIPFTFLFWIRLLQSRKWRDTCLLALFTVLTMLSNMHFAVFMVYALALWTLYEMLVGGVRPTLRRIWKPAVLAPCVALLVMPVFVHYLNNDPRPMETVREYSCAAYSFMNPYRYNFLYGKWFQRGPVWFPGAIATLLSLGGLLALFSGRIRERRNTLALVLIGLMAALVSFGPACFLHRFAWKHLPGFDGIRAIERINILYLLALAIMAAHGLAFIQERIKSSYARYCRKKRRYLNIETSGDRAPELQQDATSVVPALFLWKYRATGNTDLKRSRSAFLAPVLAVIACVAVLAESFPYQRRLYRHHPTACTRYEWLKDHDDVHNVLFLPMINIESSLTLGSAFHGKKMVNGYSGHFPPLYTRFKNEQVIPPTPEQVELLRSTGVDHLVFDGRHVDIDGVAAAVGSRPDLDAVERKNDLLLVAIGNEMNEH